MSHRMGEGGWDASRTYAAGSRYAGIGTSYDVKQMSNTERQCYHKSILSPFPTAPHLPQITALVEVNFHLHVYFRVSFLSFFLFLFIPSTAALNFAQQEGPF